LSKTQRDRAIAAVRSLINEPRPNGVKKIKGYDETYRIRFGDYRVIYKVQDKELIILLLSVSHRKDAY
jgi:mRNA interferase RelE/StbE